MAELAIRYRDKGVVAVDLAGAETIEKTQQHIKAFKVILYIVLNTYNCMHGVCSVVTEVCNFVFM